MVFLIDHQKSVEIYINPFVPSAPFLYSLKTSEDVTDVFTG